MIFFIKDANLKAIYIGGGEGGVLGDEARVSEFFFLLGIKSKKPKTEKKIGGGGGGGGWS